MSLIIQPVFYHYEKQRTQHLAKIYEVNEQLDRRAQTDRLTGIANRRYFEGYLERA
jgi:PleD family two-component response regulator